MNEDPIHDPLGEPLHEETAILPERETFTVQRGSNHFYITSSREGYIAKTLGDSEEALRAANRIVEGLNA
jgi:hypothetical protein